LNIDKVGGQSKIILSIILLGTLFLSTPLALAQDCDPVYVYDGSVQIKTGYKGSNSYFKISLNGVPVNGWIPFNDDYHGWCVDIEQHVSANTWYDDSLLYSSLNPDIPSCMQDDEDWNKVNYLLNQIYADTLESPYDGASKEDIQQAIWYFTDAGYYVNKFTDDGWSGDSTIVNEIIDDVNANGEDFIPIQGEIFAIIIAPDGALLENPCSPNRHQLIIIPYEIPPCFEVPELPLGTITALLTPLAALGAAALRKRRDN